MKILISLILLFCAGCGFVSVPDSSGSGRDRRKSYKPTKEIEVKILKTHFSHRDTYVILCEEISKFKQKNRYLFSIETLPSFDYRHYKRNIPVEDEIWNVALNDRDNIIEFEYKVE